MTGIRPAVPADLQPPASRLYRMAAEHLTYLFGRTTCPACEADVSVPEQIEASFRAWNGPGFAQDFGSGG